MFINNYLAILYRQSWWAGA